MVPKSIIVLSLVTLFVTCQCGTIKLPPGVGAKGVTHVKGSLFFIADIVTGDIVLVDSKSRLIMKTIRNDKLRTTLGLHYDGGKYIYSAGTGPIFSSISKPLYNLSLPKQKSMMYVYDIQTSKLFASCPVEKGLLLDSVVVDTSKRYAYYSDSVGRHIHRLSVKDLPNCKIDHIPLPKNTFGLEGTFGAHGIAFFKGGLIVTNFGEGSLYFIDLKNNNKSTRLTPAGFVSLADGITLIPKKTGSLLLCGQNNQISVFKLSIKHKTRRVNARRIQVIRRPFFANIGSVAVNMNTIVVTNVNSTARALDEQLSVSTFPLRVIESQ